MLLRNIKSSFVCETKESSNSFIDICNSLYITRFVNPTNFVIKNFTKLAEKTYRINKVIIKSTQIRKNG